MTAFTLGIASVSESVGSGCGHKESHLMLDTKGSI